MQEPVAPYLDYEPAAPSKYINMTVYVQPTQTDMSIKDFLNEVPKNIRSKLRVRVYTRYIDDAVPYDNIEFYYVDKQRNQNYKEQLASYKISLKKYNERKVIYREEIKQYLKDVVEYLKWAKDNQCYVNKYKYDELIKTHKLEIK